jgi:hypothetical protein
MEELNYLTEEEANMPLEMALLQLVLGLQTCKTKDDVVELLRDAVELGRRSVPIVRTELDDMREGML